MSQPNDFHDFSPLTGRCWEPSFKPFYLILWFAVAAILLKIDIAADNALGRATTIFGAWTTYVLHVDVLVLAAALTGAGVLLWSSRGNFAARFQPGHWILMNLAIITLTGKLLWITGRWQLAINQDAMLLGIAAVANVLGAILYGYAAIRLQGTLQWKASFWSFTTLNTVVATAVIVLATHCDATANPIITLQSLPSWTVQLLLICLGGCVIALMSAIAIDLWNGTRRHWLHWLGVASVAASVLLPALWHVAVPA